MDQLDPQDVQGNQPAQNMESMEALLEEIETGFDLPVRGEIRKGTIASVQNDQIMVSIGAKSEGIIGSREMESFSDEEKAAFKVGQEINVYVVNPEDRNGNLMLSYSRAREADSWDAVEEMEKNKEVSTCKVVGYNKGGVLVNIKNLNGFVPASQLALSRRMDMSGDTPEDRWGDVVGEQIEVRVIEVDRNRRRLILSERAASSETRESLKEKVIDSLEVGDVYTGRVTSLASFGAFVNINGADGLVHLSEISWDRINDPSEVLEVGQEVEVKVISVVKEKKRIGLSLRQLQDDPWAIKAREFEVGQMVECKITRLTSFGAFAEIEPGFEGLVHISELSEHRVEHPKEMLHEGDEVNLRIIKIEPEEHRIGLSLRRVDSMKYAEQDWQELLDDANFGSDDDKNDKYDQDDDEDFEFDDEE
jgi:small subunit ribosomal protein S1